MQNLHPTYNSNKENCQLCLYRQSPKPSPKWSVPCADERKPYTAPSVQYMGTLKDIIQFNNLGLNPDGDPSGFGFS